MQHRYWATALSGTLVSMTLGSGLLPAQAEETQTGTKTQPMHQEVEISANPDLPIADLLEVPSEAELSAEEGDQLAPLTSKPSATADALKPTIAETSNSGALLPTHAQEFERTEESKVQPPTLFLETSRQAPQPSFTNGPLAQTLTQKPPETPQSSSETPQTTDKEDWPSPVKDNQTFSFVLIDQLEVRTVDGPTTLNWDAIGWVGGDIRRFWFKTEGDVGLSADTGGEAEVQALYGQLVAPFWDFQAGLRYDRLYGPGPDRGRAFAVVGIQGLAPYLLEVDASLFISEDGDVSARLTGEYEMLLTQRLILQPKAEINLAAQRVENFGVGSGLNDIELGLRLRYEISRKFAPYVGINWQRKFFETADLAREEGESVGDFSALAGVRLLF